MTTRSREDETPVLIPGEREYRGGGWVMDTVVRYRGRDIGRIQTRCENGVESELTIGPERSRFGRQVEWLIAEATKGEWAGRTFRSPHTRRREAA